MPACWPHNQIAGALARYPLIQTVFALSARRKQTTYLVGGTVRDILIGGETHDLDFAVQGSGLSLARYLADQLGGYFVPLDQERRTGRVLLPRSGASQPPAGQPFPTSPPRYLDVASLRGDNLLADLQGRDFTLNAIALSPTEDGGWQIHDPLHGSEDLHNRVLRAASPSSLSDDPVRTLRAVRLQYQLNCQIEPQTRTYLAAAVPLLQRVSAERVRDEWFKILQLEDAATVLEEMVRLDLLYEVAPPIARSERLAHALETVRAAERLWAALDDSSEPTLPGNQALLPESLYRLAPHLLQRYAALICDERSYLALLKCAALLHPLAEKSAPLATRWRLSKREAELLHTAVCHYQDVGVLAQAPHRTRRSIYRFYAQTGEPGIDAALLFLAHTLAAGDPDPSRAEWAGRAKTVAQLLKAWFEHRETHVHPSPLLSGKDVMQVLGRSPGPQIGAILSQLAEEQAAGEISTRQQALDYLWDWMTKQESC
jgi:tRNA nucleotidyltransferase/poly(A) polymerase